MSKARRKLGISALFTLSLLLLASASLRIGLNAGSAWASAGAAEPTAEGEAAPPLECPQPPAALAAALTEREKQASVRETAIQERQAALDLAEQVIARRLTELEQAESALRETLSVADKAAETDLTQLTEVYQAMKPKDAAALFDGMDPEFAAGFLGRMRPAEAAAIMSGMAPEKAYAVSALLAGRNANVPKE